MNPNPFFNPIMSFQNYDKLINNYDKLINKIDRLEKEIRILENIVNKSDNSKPIIHDNPTDMYMI